MLRHLSFGASGPHIARLFGQCLAIILIVAWVSLGVQVSALVGDAGILSWNAYLAEAGDRLSWWRAPTLFFWGVSDTVLVLGVILGIALALAALCDRKPRLCFALSVPLYLSYAVIGRTFLSFQWDNLLLECLFLAALLPRERAAPWMHFALRILFLKIYFESGVAKWQSSLGDWHDGSAMTFYYETAPLPGWLAWHFHHLPDAWHAFEGWLTLFIELVLPLGIFFSRYGRLAALVCLTGFQLVNLLTANYGFFVYLSLGLHLFLLDDVDVQRIKAFVRTRIGVPLRRRLTGGDQQIFDWMESIGTVDTATKPAGSAARPWWTSVVVRRWILRGVVVLYVALSCTDGLGRFADMQWTQVLRPIYGSFRVINTYHLFGHITRDRIEPEFQVQTATGWQTLTLHYKPGPLDRAPGWVAPHQPRVDFQLWFHGLSYRRMPSYLWGMLRGICVGTQAAQSFFEEPLPANPEAVRLVYWKYTFTTPEERDLTGDWWRQSPVGQGRHVLCSRFL